MGVNIFIVRRKRTIEGPLNILWRSIIGQLQTKRSQNKETRGRTTMALNVRNQNQCVSDVFRLNEGPNLIKITHCFPLAPH